MENSVEIKKDRLWMQELAILGLIKAGKAHLHHVMVPINGRMDGEIIHEPHTFYKLDCPDPNLRKDGSIWPDPPGTVRKFFKLNSKRRMLPQEEIH